MIQAFVVSAFSNLILSLVVNKKLMLIVQFINNCTDIVHYLHCNCAFLHHSSLRTSFRMFLSVKIIHAESFGYLLLSKNIPNQLCIGLVIA